MRRFLANHRKVLLATETFTFAAMSFVIWQAAASSRGDLHARYDIWGGHYKVMAIGLPLSDDAEYSAILAERYGIERQRLAFCIVSSELLAYTGAYNKRSMGAAERKYGRDVFEKSHEAAKALWRQKHPELANRTQGANLQFLKTL